MDGVVDAAVLSSAASQLPFSSSEERSKVLLPLLPLSQLEEERGVAGEGS